MVWYVPPLSLYRLQALLAAVGVPRLRAAGRARRAARRDCRAAANPGCGGARALLQMVGRDTRAGAPTALRRDIRPAQALGSLPHVLRRRGQARARGRAAAPQTAYRAAGCHWRAASCPTSCRRCSSSLPPHLLATARSSCASTAWSGTGGATAATNSHGRAAPHSFLTAACWGGRALRSTTARSRLSVGHRRPVHPRVTHQLGRGQRAHLPLVLRGRVVTYLLLTVLILLGCWMTFGHNLATDSPYNYLVSIGRWWQSLFYLQPNVSAISGAPLIYQLHAIVAWSFWALFPFSRLVHAWSIPLQYLGRLYILYPAATRQSAEACFPAAPPQPEWFPRRNRRRSGRSADLVSEPGASTRCAKMRAGDCSSRDVVARFEVVLVG